VLGLLQSMSHPGRDGDEIVDGLPYFVALEVAGYLVEGLDSGYLVQRCVEEPVESRSPACPTVTAPMIWSRCRSEKQSGGASASVIAADRGKSGKEGAAETRHRRLTCLLSRLVYADRSYYGASTWPRCNNWSRR
jgi:hypothetical protein